ncbi:hypothetical protein J2S03_000569 [Alicyclobacillus cycloheptanicus]|uniref:Uncharacterized protein n=1 Tax=Alicyclobacillus cycloheptanicus TaxID=1457 RepID=A0ABT9XEN1_9BACL|nr:hypothetical protein [Alicyclobacillus cycloheptanicus]
MAWGRPLSRTAESENVVGATGGVHGLTRSTGAMICMGLAVHGAVFGEGRHKVENTP